MHVFFVQANNKIFEALVTLLGEFAASVPILVHAGCMSKFRYFAESKKACRVDPFV